MKNKTFITLLLALVAMLALSLPALGQGSFDLFGGPRYLVLDSGTDLTNHSGTLNASNAPVDIHGFEGVGVILFSAQEYAGSSGKIYARAETSSDGTNWTLASNFAAATSTAYYITNKVGGHVETNTYLLPGTVTTPTVATAGFASPYLSATAMTSTAVLATNVSSALNVFGFVIQDQPRYVHVAYTVTGSDVAFKTSAFIVSRKQAGEFFY